MTDSILTSIKKLLGITENDESFDDDIVIYINSVFMTLTQFGVGPTTGFSISSKTSVWGDFLHGNKNLEAVKTYIYLKTRMLFDPPTNAALISAIDSTIKETEYRLITQVEDFTPIL